MSSPPFHSFQWSLVRVRACEPTTSCMYAISGSPYIPFFFLTTTSTMTTTTMSTPITTTAAITPPTMDPTEDPASQKNRAGRSRTDSFYVELSRSIQSTPRLSGHSII